MLFVIYIFLILICVLKPNSKKVFIITLLFLWFLAAFCTSTADTSVYQLRYNGYATMSSMTEPGYTLLMFIFNKIGLTYEMFLGVIYAIILGIIASFIWRNSFRPNTTLALYAILSYSIDMVQIRSTLAFAVVLIGVDALLNYNKRKGMIKFLFSIALGSTIHFSVFIYMLLLIPVLLDIKKSLIVTAISILILGVASNISVISNIVSVFVGSERADSILGRVNRYMTDSVSTIRWVVIICFIISLVMLLMVHRNLKKKMFYDEREYNLIANYRTKTELIIKFQLIMLITLPIISFVLDIYRLNRYLLLVTYVSFSFYRLGKTKKQFIDSKIFTFVNYIAVLIMFYVQIYALNNLHKAFWVFFESNSIF